MKKLGAKITHIFMVFIPVISVGCANLKIDEPTKIIVSGHVANILDTTVNFSYYKYDLLENLATQPVNFDDNGNFKMQIDSKKPLKGWFSFGKEPVTRKFTFTTNQGKDSTMTQGTFDFKMLYLYLKPGDSVHIITDANDLNSKTEFHGNINDDIAFTIEEEKRFNDYKHKFLRNWYDVSQRKPKDFIKSVENLYNEKMAFLKEFQKSNSLSEELINFYKANAFSSLISSKINYPKTYATYNEGSTLILPDDYFDFLESVRLQEDIPQNGIGYFYNLKSYLTKKYEIYQNISSEPVDFYDWISTELPEKIRYQYMAYSLAGDFSKRLYEAFNENCPYPEMAKVVREKYQHLEGMLEGSEAPNVTFETIDGTKVMLNELRGKYTYIDLWATWCGPCIKEIPSLQKVEKLYHGKNIQFVSVSFDSEKDHDKWVHYVKNNGLTGLQFIASKETHTILSKQYNIKTIPRFILLDPDGKIIDATAPFPSDPALIKLFEKHHI
ncbi:TlpA family protein disulfide reductase [Flavobacteriaceae bacterium F08102]|nr:TlpA family protein disulfide reductase [Flavobacteriaceae bacterium F08102]